MPEAVKSELVPASVCPAGSLFQRRVITPLIHLLRMGASPRRLAWSLAIGLAVGINPLLGSTTVACLIVAFGLRLNLVASQITNHLVYPLQLALFVVFMDAGDRLFLTGGLPLDRHELLEAMRHHPLSTTRMLWSWEWHALIVWLLFALLLTPVAVAILTPLLRGLLVKLQADPA